MSTMSFNTTNASLTSNTFQGLILAGHKINKICSYFTMYEITNVYNIELSLRGEGVVGKPLHAPHHSGRERRVHSDLQHLVPVL